MRSRRSVLAACVIACAAACGDLLDERPDAPLEDGGPPDASAPPDGAVPDAPVPTCSERFDAGPLILCDDFEREDPRAPSWLTVFTANGSVTSSTLHARSGSRSLLTEVPDAKPEGSNLLASLVSRDFDAGTFPLVIEFDMLVESVPAFADQPFNGFIFGAFGGDSEVLFYAGVSAVGAYNPYLMNGEAPVQVPLGEWLHVAVTVDDAKTSMVFQLPNGGQNVVRERVISMTTPPRNITIGLDVGSGGGPARVFFDDVVVHH